MVLHASPCREALKPSLTDGRSRERHRGQRGAEARRHHSVRRPRPHAPLLRLISDRHGDLASCGRDAPRRRMTHQQRNGAPSEARSQELKAGRSRPIIAVELPFGITLTGDEILTQSRSGTMRPAHACLFGTPDPVRATAARVDYAVILPATPFASRRYRDSMPEGTAGMRARGRLPTRGDVPGRRTRLTPAPPTRSSSRPDP